MKTLGGCVCGGTRYELLAAPEACNDCHCIDCRRSSGAPFVTWGSVRRKDLVVTHGEPREIVHAGRLRSFASCCGTHLFFRESKEAEWIDVTIATLDDPFPFPPRKAIWIEDKLPWVTLDPHFPSFTKNENA